MFDPTTILVLVLLVGAWGLQIWLSSLQMRRFHRRSQELRWLGEHLAIGMAGTTYRRKTYVTLVTDAQGRVVTAERLAGFTIFSNLKPIEGLSGLTLDRLESGEPAAGVDPKTWSAIAHAAGFIRTAIQQSQSATVKPNDVEGGAMA